MVGPGEVETNEPRLEKAVKMKISYHQLLLWGINDVRVALGLRSPDEAEAKLDALIAILPPEIRPLVDEEIDAAQKRLDKRLFDASHRRLVLIETSGWPYSREEWVDETQLKNFPNAKILEEKYERVEGVTAEVMLHQKRGQLHFAFLGEVLAAIIRILDENGLLREFRKEEVGGY